MTKVQLGITMYHLSAVRAPAVQAQGCCLCTLQFGLVVRDTLGEGHLENPHPITYKVGSNSELNGFMSRLTIWLLRYIYIYTSSCGKLL